MLRGLLRPLAKTKARSGIMLLSLCLAMNLACEGISTQAGDLSSDENQSEREDVFFIRGHQSNKCLDVADSSTANGSKIQLWDCHSGKNQMWRLIKRGHEYQIRSVLTAKCLDIEGRSSGNGAKLQQWDCQNSDNQKFRFEDAGNGRRRIIAKISGKALDVNGHSKDNGTKLQQWDKTNGDNQVFALKSARLPSFVHTEGPKIVDAKGKDIAMRGINLGNWLVWEGYLMMGDFNYRTHSQFLDSLKQVFGNAEKAKEFERQWRLNYVDERAIEDLKKLGYNSVRVPFHYNLFWRGNTIVDDGFEYIDRLIEYCKKHGIYILLDMHAAPGYQNPGDHSDNVDSNEDQPRDSVKFWNDDNVNLTAKIWKHIANRYKNEGIIWGYDLFNEPVTEDGREYELLPSLVKIRNAIREVDRNHIIVAEGSWWASDLSKIDWQDKDTQRETKISSRWDDNLVYQIHHYGPAKDTFGREDTTNRLGVPLILGEFGESDNENLKKTNAWAKSKISGWFAWSFKKISHDKTLWSIPTNDRYEELKGHVNKRTKGSDELYDAMIEFAKNNIRNGHASHVWDKEFFEAVRP